MIYTGLNNTGEVEAIYGHLNGTKEEISEVYGSIGYNDPIFYSRKTLTGTSPLSYKALSKPLSNYLITGNTVQNGTPTPSDPVDVVGCGVWDEAQQIYKLPVTIGGTEYPIYLGEVQTTRKIKKLVLMGEETWWTSGTYTGAVYAYHSQFPGIKPLTPIFCTHLVDAYESPYAQGTCKNDSNSIGMWVFDTTTSPDAFKSYLAAQYAAGTPVTVWYVLANPETAVVNEPLHKIGDYADTVSFAQAGVTIPTVAGTNTLTVDTTVQPSEVSITGNIKPTGYGQLLDVNDVDIQDSNGTPKTTPDRNG